ncbi:methyltransferase domain-containing protein [Sphingomicrobium astaxanthinifaciens]|uniref:methyltransferase domain-containing protein n=1 Tax=Sphingomicrobium astaxanthinifaciens TaxID=1227949 RepID=UPI001FCAF787|nr:methyltransferase domain-containing protein [Sphingomicrobium astaxanthinifaciens]MCJ7420622.1 methyltransferase domain-containing protein [Sphingomicrobium astaxanthinifaciens]
MPNLFDSDLRALRRARAWRLGPPAFLADRVIEDMTDRLAAMNRPFPRALLIGTLAGAALDRFAPFVDRLDRVDPSALVAEHTDARAIAEDALDAVGTYDLVIALGTLDTVADLPETLTRLRLLLKPDRPLLGVMPGGETLPVLRRVMRAADRVTGRASPHVHPRIEPAALADLLAQAGLVMPVVDIDRLRLAYRGLGALLRDLRAAGATNLLAERDRKALDRLAYRAASDAFAQEADASGRTVETFELLHFHGWSPGAADTVL